MADFFNRLLSRFGNAQDDLDYDENYSQDDVEFEPAETVEAIRPSPFRRQQAKVVDIRSTPAGVQQQHVIILQPSDIETAQQACDHIRSGKTVICNIERVDTKVAQRVIDFITGAAYALDGRVMPVSSVIFVVAPRNTALIEGNTGHSGMDYVRQAVAR